MPFWKRSKSEWELAQKAFATPTQSGDQPCSEPFCERHDAVVCGYMDPRGHRCRTASCPIHQEVIDELAYCPLHAETMRAVGLKAGDSHLPMIDNPGPSLVSWVARDMHDRMVEILSGYLQPELGERIIADDIVTPVRAADGSRRWEQAWKVVSHTGISLKVTVRVEERNPTRVVVWVASHAVAEGTPPWFQGVQRRERPTGDEVIAERREFYDPIFAHIVASIESERALGARGPY